MKCNRAGLSVIKFSLLYLIALTIAGCGSSSDDDKGYIRLYNASPNAPQIYLTVDENLDEDDDDEVEVTYSGVAFSKVSASNALDTGRYFTELAWRDEESGDRSDLEVIFEDSVDIKSDNISFYALTGDILTPDVLAFDIPVVDDDEDDDDDLFNIRVLNLHPDYQNVDLYMSKDNETFNEAVLVQSANYKDLSDNIKVEQDQYVFYITEVGSTDVLYTSVAQSYSVVTQYVIAIRENMGVGSSPFAIDNIGINGTTELDDVDSEAEFSFYNAIAESEYIPEYQGSINISVGLKGEKINITDLQLGEFSELISGENGDYDFSVSEPNSQTLYINNALLSLKENASNAIFIYGKEEPIDDDNDGDFDENDDGIVDGYETKIKSLSITKSDSTSIYSHNIRIINLTDSEDFSRVTFYFVQSDEIISTADNKLSVLQESSGNISLLNNTYELHAIATIDGIDIKLDSMELILNINSKDQFLLFEADEFASTGFKMTLVDQRAD
ncbi:DUF4397 domain-containing protein [Paraglaciecola aquimarina]|uniref:DUF4397 domain-containing protein n=1 Tax=Paraglaciecola aquimarina TaxID=1235557 RepID=A0ABU3STA5_9ALTE|nr:DUF4397 domain-containing protein [Paraglaciecola aquimarina]MDU0353240.1 DUF4397 domain-containing protein [Paraglaciecola aquimarina]